MLYSASTSPSSSTSTTSPSIQRSWLPDHTSTACPTKYFAAVLLVLCIVCDSQLLVRHVTGAYEARAEHLVPRVRNIREKSRRFSEFSITHVLRSENKEADSAANRALDECSALVIAKRLLRENEDALRDAFPDDDAKGGGGP